MSKEQFLKLFKVGDIVTSFTWELMSPRHCNAKIVYISKTKEELCIEDEDGLTIISYLSYNLKKVKDG